MAKWEPKVVTLKGYPVSEHRSQEMLAELAELFYNILASSKVLNKVVTIGSPDQTRRAS